MTGGDALRRGRTYDRRELAGAVVLALTACAVGGLRPAVRVVAPELAVQAQARRDRFDPWGRPYIHPPRPTAPGREFGGWTGPVYSVGPDGVDDTAAVVSVDQLSFPLAELFPPGRPRTTQVEVSLPRPAFDDRRDGRPCPAWDGHFRPLLANDDLLVSGHLTLATQLLTRDVEAWLIAVGLGLCWLLVVGRRVRRDPRRWADLLRLALFASVPVACAAWIGGQLAAVPAVGRDVGTHPLVPLPLALGGSAALAALVAALFVRANAAAADPGTADG